MGEVREEILPEMIANGTRVWRGPHITGFVEEWLRRKRGPRAAEKIPAEELRRAA